VDELVMKGRNTSCVIHLNICTLEKGVVNVSMCEHCSSGHQACQASSNAPVIISIAVKFFIDGYRDIGPLHLTPVTNAQMSYHHYTIVTTGYVFTCGTLKSWGPEI